MSSLVRAGGALAITATQGRAVVAGSTPCCRCARAATLATDSTPAQRHDKAAQASSIPPKPQATRVMVVVVNASRPAGFLDDWLPG
jgi:hypothetical protein